MKKKATYRIRNWREYHRALTQRGNLSVWLSAEAIANWTTEELTGALGASPTYTDLAFETMPRCKLSMEWLGGRRKACSNRSLP